jgi:hypothetical protein
MRAAQSADASGSDLAVPQTAGGERRSCSRPLPAAEPELDDQHREGDTGVDTGAQTQITAHTQCAQTHRQPGVRLLTSLTALLQGGAAPDDVNQRCALTKGDWCRAFYQQQPIPAKPPTTGTKPCLWGCNRVGVSGWCRAVLHEGPAGGLVARRPKAATTRCALQVCDGLAGWCRCPAGEEQLP